jgi:predicted ArsR family transcriptional regulator
MPTNATDIDAVALLGEPARRSLYEAVVAAPDALSRDQAASAAGVTRALAAFHLDKLVEAGLLDVEYRRLTGRTGPGAGRPSKLYRRGLREIGVSLPSRHYEVPAGLFATALQMVGPTPPDALLTAAHDAGEEIGAAARQRSGPRPSRRRLRVALEESLEARGYEPAETPSGEIRFQNCPFHALVDEHRDLVCNMNLALADGILDGLGAPHFSARLDPQPGQCCVAISSAQTVHSAIRETAPRRSSRPRA